MGQAELGKYDPKRFTTARDLRKAYHDFRREKEWYPAGTIFIEGGRSGGFSVDYPKDPEVINNRLTQLQAWLERARELNEHDGILDDEIREIESIVADLTEKLRRAENDALIGQPPIEKLPPNVF